MPDTRQQPFDEQAVLRELERLHHAILASRKDREHAVAEFDTFVKGFRSPEPLPGPDVEDVMQAPLIRGPWLSDATIPHAPKTAAAQAQPPVIPIIGPAPIAAPEPAPIKQEPGELPPPQVDPIVATIRRRLQEQDAAAREEKSPVDSRLSRSPFVVAAAAAGVAVIALLLFLISSGRSAPSVSTVDAPPAREAAAPAAREAAQPARQGAPVSARALRVELTAVRPVWMRVTVDDNRALERQVLAGERFPLEADRSIVVRAGDAGAVRLVVDGRDAGVLGADGQVITRAFTPQPTPTDRVPR